MANSLEAWSLAGTWTATVLAIIALFGIVGPIYATRLAYNTKSRALNGVYDADQKYLSKGVSFGKGPRFFIRPRVPNLARNYSNNSPHIACILPEGDDPADYCYLDRQPDALSWNTGWARLCALIQSYRTSETSKTEMCSNSTDGNLEIIDSYTALVVSRYWIMFLGLVGVYGQKELARVHRLPHQPDDITHSGASSNFYGADIESDCPTSSNSNWDNRPRARRTRPRFPRSQVWPKIDDDNIYKGVEHSESQKMEYRAYYSRQGTQIYSSSPAKEIAGYTGTFISLGRHKYATGIRSLVAFKHAVRKENRPSVPPLEDRFWIAFGFIPRRNTEAISFQDPSQYAQHTWNPLVNYEQRTRYLRLEESSRLPSLLVRCSSALRIKYQFKEEPYNKWKILQWKACVEDDVNDQELHKTEDEYDFLTTFIWKHDMVKSLDAFLHIDYDDWGLLVRKSRGSFWHGILRQSALKINSYIPVLAFLERLRQDRKPEATAFLVPPWDYQQHSHSDFASNIKDFVQLEKDVLNLIEESKQWVRYCIGIAFILDGGLREDMTNVLRAYDPEDNSNKSERSSPSQILPSIRKLFEEPEYDRFQHTESDDQSPAYMGSLLQDHDSQLFAEDTSADTPVNQTSNLKEPIISGLSVTYCPSAISSTSCSSRPTGPVLRVSWKRLRSNDDVTIIEIPNHDLPFFVSPDDRKQDVIHLEEDDVVLIAIWAVVKCALWRSFQDSAPLMEFMNDLDRNVFVM